MACRRCGSVMIPETLDIHFGEEIAWHCRICGNIWSFSIEENRKHPERMKKTPRPRFGRYKEARCG